MVHDSAARAPDRDVHEWLVWTEADSDRLHPQQRGQWLELGISLRDVAVLSDTAYRPHDVRELARQTGFSTTRAGALLAGSRHSACRASRPWQLSAG